MKFSQLKNPKNDFMTLFRVSKGGPPNPDHVRFYSRKGKEHTKGIFFTRNPQQVASNHGIMPGRSRGNLNVYKIHKSVKRMDGVVYGVYDNAWEFFIPSSLWVRLVENGLVKFEGRSEKIIRNYMDSCTVAYQWMTNVILKRLEDEKAIERARKYSLETRKMKKKVYLIDLVDCLAPNLFAGFNTMSVLDKAEKVFKSKGIYFEPRK